MIKIRPFKRSDAATIASWVTSEREYFMWSAGLLGGYPVSDKTLLDLADSIADDPRKFQMVAYDEKGIFAHVLFRYPTEDDTVVRLGFVIVDKERRGQGLGKDMLKQFVSYAFDLMGAQKVTLGVYENNKMAYRAYLSAGFYEINQKNTVNFLNEDWVCTEMECYNPIADVSSSSMDTVDIQKIAEAIDNNSFVYAFQPIVYATNGEIYGYEALMRTEDVGRNILPLDILKCAKDSDKLYAIEKRTLFNVMSRYDACQREFKDRKIFVNTIAGCQLSDSDYQEFSGKYGKYFCNMVLELTEQLSINQSELDILLSRSGRDGFSLAIDNYGTGFSNTSSLLKYYPNCVKLDRLLVANINDDSRKQHFVQSIIQFAHNNGFMALAEGVETYEELKSVIRLGVDLIQGFYVSRPAFDVIDTLTSSIKRTITELNDTGHNPDNRKIYVLSEVEEAVPLVRLALEQYSGISISKPEVTLVGNASYAAEMSVKIEDGTTCTLKLKDVSLESYMHLPCLELGENVDLTLVIEGENRMRKCGIYVPESASIKIIGDGNLGIRTTGIRNYGIGNIWSAPVGKIEWAGTGSLDILVEADEGIGIGGGNTGKDSFIKLSGGLVRIEPACAKSIAVGTVKGNLPIVIKECTIQIDIKTDSGIGIGCAADKQSIWISDSKVNIVAAGSKISAMGNLAKTAGTIEISNTEVSILANAAKLFLIGAMEGDPHLRFTDTNIDIRAEGGEVLGIGTRDMGASVVANHTNTVMRIVSGNPITFGAQADRVIYRGGTRTMAVNE